MAREEPLAAGQPPVIDDVDHPASLAPGESGDLKITAHDPDAAPLKLEVTAFDESQNPSNVFNVSIDVNDPLTYQVRVTEGSGTVTQDPNDPTHFIVTAG